MKLSIVLALLAAVLGQAAPQYPPPYPRPGTTQIFDNDVITVWDVSWLKQKYPLHTHRYDLIGVSYVEGDRLITQGDAPGRLTTTKPWVFQANVAGNTHVEEGASDPPMRAILMEVKSPAPAADVTEPPDGLHQVLGTPSWRNKRSDAWAIPPGTAAPIHRHVLNAVELIFDASTPAKTPKVNFVPAGTVHAGPTPEPGGRVFIFEIR
jgi:hypothetical protein